MYSVRGIPRDFPDADPASPGTPKTELGFCPARAIHYSTAFRVVAIGLRPLWSWEKWSRMPNCGLFRPVGRAESGLPLPDEGRKRQMARRVWEYGWSVDSRICRPILPPVTDWVEPRVYISRGRFGGLGLSGAQRREKWRWTTHGETIGDQSASRTPKGNWVARPKLGTRLSVALQGRSGTRRLDMFGIL